MNDHRLAADAIASLGRDHVRGRMTVTQQLTAAMPTLRRLLYIEAARLLGTARHIEAAAMLLDLADQLSQNEPHGATEMGHTESRREGAEEVNGDGLPHPAREPRPADEPHP